MTEKTASPGSLPISSSPIAPPDSSSSPLLKTRDGAAITDWREWTPPKDAKHWKAGRSAMELARAWFTSRTPQCPAEIEALLNKHSATSKITFVSGVPEAITGLPGGGGGRNHDLLLLGTRGEERVVVSVEGKADERFGNETVGSYYRKAQASVKPTRADQRIESLLEMVFGTKACPDQLPWSALRYQLLTGVAATVVEADKQGCSVGVFLIHEFHTHLVTPVNTAANDVDYASFIEALCQIPRGLVKPGVMYQAPLMAMNRFISRPIQLFIGKATFDWTEKSKSSTERDKFK